MDLYLGIDGGGTKTTACLVKGEGKIVGQAEAGPSNPLKVGLRVAELEIENVYRRCLRNCGLIRTKSTPALPVLQGVCAGISGSARDSVRQPLLAWLRKHIPARRHLLTIDAEIALCAAVRDSPGIIVIAGTGSIAYARDENGMVLRTGGWGIPFDDLGSGYDIGRKGVTAALESYDGRGPRTKLAAMICKRFRLDEIPEIVGLRLDQQQIAALFPLVIEAGNSGDRVARKVCDNAAKDLAGLAVALLKKVGRLRRSTKVVTAGGVFSTSDRIRRSFSRHLRSIAPRVQVEMLKNSPVDGAVWLARNLDRKEI